MGSLCHEHTGIIPAKAGDDKAMRTQLIMLSGRSDSIGTEQAPACANLSPDGTGNFAGADISYSQSEYMEGVLRPHICSI